MFLDSAASAQKPRVVIDAMVHVMEAQYANVHRGLHWMSEKTSDAYEAVRDKIAAFLNAASREEIVFTRNATEAINLVAYTYGRTHCSRAMRSWSPRWSTTPIWCPGRCCATQHGVELRDRENH